MLADRNGIPIGWATDGANRHDVILFEPTLAAGQQRRLIVDIDTLHLDRGDDNGRVCGNVTGQCSSSRRPSQR